LAVAPYVARGLAVHVVLRVEGLDLSRNLGVEAVRVEAGDVTHSRNAFDHVRPDGFDVVADRSDEAKARHSHTATI
jgi:hypothetical protein